MSAAAPESTIERLEGIIIGSAGTPYVGGQFAIKISIPARYPFEPPKVSYEDANLCLSPALYQSHALENYIPSFVSHTFYLSSSEENFVFIIIPLGPVHHSNLSSKC